MNTMPEVASHENSSLVGVVSSSAITKIPSSASKAAKSTTTTTVVSTTTLPPNDDSIATSAIEKDPPAKKNKRTAEHQITKDEYDANRNGDNDEDDADDEIIQNGFQRASAEVLAKRKILRAIRPSVAAITSNPFVTTNLTGAKKDNNDDTENNNNDTPIKPVEATNSLSSTANGTSSSSALGTSSSLNEVPETMHEKKEMDSSGNTAKKDVDEGKGTPHDAVCKPKVFGSGSALSGFQTAVSGTGFGFRAFGTPFSNGNDASSGFGAVASLGTGFGKASTSSLFGVSSTGFSSLSTSAIPATSPLKSTGDGVPSFTFGNLSNETEKQLDNKSDVNVEEEVDVAIEGSNSAVSLPTQVQLTTGEEDEEVIHDGRCKSFHWVLKPPEEVTSSNASGTAAETSANPSVKPSTVFQAVISTATTTSTKSNNNLTRNEKLDDDSKKDEEANTEEDKDDETSKVNIADKELPEQTFKWQELGVGPMKILSSTSNDGKYRVVQRRESTPNGPATKVILNVPLWKESTANRTASRYLTLKTLVDGKVESYSFRFKDSSDASYFLHYLLEAIPNAKSAFVGAD